MRDFRKKNLTTQHSSKMTWCCTCRCKFSLSVTVEQSIAVEKNCRLEALCRKNQSLTCDFLSMDFPTQNWTRIKLSGLSWFPLEANEDSIDRNSSSERKIQGVEQFSEFTLRGMCMSVCQRDSFSVQNSNYTISHREEMKN